MGSGNSMSTSSTRGTPLNKQRALSSPDQKVDSASPPTTMTGKRSHGVRRAGSWVLRALVVVKENAVTLLLPPLRKAMPGRRRSTSRDNASAARRTSSKDQRCWIRTFTCIPREPLVFAQPRSPTSSRNDFTSRATRRASRQSTPGPGIKIDSQFVRVLEIAGAHGVRMQFDAAQIDDPGEPVRNQVGRLMGARF